MKAILYISLVVIIIGALILGGCGTKTTSTPPTSSPTSAPTAEPVYGGTLKLGNMMSGSTGDWAFPATQMSDRWYNVSFEPLIRVYMDGRMEGLLATKWEFAEDYLSLTLTIRQGVKFTDGSDLNANVVKWNLDKQKEYKKPITAFFSSVDVVDDYTVKISLNEYQNTILQNLGNLVGLMYSQAAFEKNGLDWCKVNPVGTGPFKFESMEADVQSTYVKNENYWQPGKPYLDAFQTFIIPELTTLKVAMLKGDIDYMLPSGGGSVTIKELENEGYVVVSRPDTPVCVLPDSDNPDSPYAKTEVRQAVSYALDRVSICKLMAGYEVPAYQLPAPYYPAYDEDYKGPTYDLEKAKQLMEAAGLPDGFKTTIASPFMPQDIMVAIQGCLSKIGIDAAIDAINMGQFTEMLTNGWSNTLFGIPITPYPNWAFGLQMQLSTSAMTYKSIKRPEGIDALLEQALSTPEEDVAITRQVLRSLEEPCYVIPIFYSSSTYVFSTKVHDSGHLSLANTVYWTPENAWLSK